MELAFVAALQHLPATQRPVLILREVLAFSAAGVATMLGTTVAAVNSALQPARQGLDRRVGGTSQQTTPRALGDQGQRELVAAFVAGWERADVPALRDMLAEDARLAMPPLVAWFDGRENIGHIFAERVFATPWRLFPLSANGQLAFACYRQTPDNPQFRRGALGVLTLGGGRIAEITAFLDPAIPDQFGLPPVLPEGDDTRPLPMRGING